MALAPLLVALALALAPRKMLLFGRLSGIGSHTLFHAKYKIAACKAEQIHKVTTTTT